MCCNTLMSLLHPRVMASFLDMERSPHTRCDCMEHRSNNKSVSVSVADCRFQCQIFNSNFGSASRFKILDFRFWISDSEFQISDFRFQIARKPLCSLPLLTLFYIFLIQLAIQTIHKLENRYPCFLSILTGNISPICPFLMKILNKQVYATVL
jgi:hypothetical protein